MAPKLVWVGEGAQGEGGEKACRPPIMFSTALDHTTNDSSSGSRQLPMVPS